MTVLWRIWEDSELELVPVSSTDNSDNLSSKLKLNKLVVQTSLYYYGSTHLMQFHTKIVIRATFRWPA